MMHDYTKLKIKDLKHQLLQEAGEEERKVKESLAKRLPYSGILTSKCLEIRYKYIDKFVRGMFDFEKYAILSERSMPQESDFADLKIEIIRIIEEEYKIIRSRALQYIRSMGAGGEDDIILEVQRQESLTREIINNGIDTMQIELSLEIKNPSQGLVVPGISSNFAKNKDIFLAHMFKEEGLIGKLKSLIEKKKYNWKEGKREDLGSISEDILSKIKNCGFFIALMTKKELLESGEFTTSSWLIEEKGAALAFGHRPLIMVEEGVKRHYVGFLQSDDEMIFFDRSNFDSKIKEAIEKIDNTYKTHAHKNN